MLQVLNVHFPRDVSFTITNFLKPECDHQDCQEATGNCEKLLYCSDCREKTYKFQSWQCSACKVFYCFKCSQNCDLCEAHQIGIYTLMAKMEEFYNNFWLYFAFFCLYCILMIIKEFMKLEDCFYLLLFLIPHL